MAVHRVVVETHSTLADTCDLCATRPPTWEYRGRGEMERVVRDNWTVINKWSESQYHICTVCGSMVETKDSHGLLARMNNGCKKLTTTRRNIRFIANFLDQLIPGRDRITGGVATV